MAGPDVLRKLGLGSLTAWLVLQSISIYAYELSDSSCISYRWVYANPRFVRSEGSGPVEASGLDYTHMGMLERLPDGQIGAAYQAATEFWEGSIKQGIYLSTSADGGFSWSAPNVIVRPAITPVWAPVFHVQGNRTWLFYAESRPPCWSWGEGGLHWACGGDIKMIFSDNSGDFWSPPKVIYSYERDGGIGKMVANKVAIGPNGEWLLPFWREQGGQDCMSSPSMHGKAGILVSEDKGGSWRVVEVPLDRRSPDTWLIEATISEFSNEGHRGYAQFFRTSVRSIYLSTSTDGLNWTSAKAISLPNPNSKVDSTTLKDGSILLAYNNNATARTPLTLARSEDGGKTWQNLIDVESDPQGAFAYPTLLYDNDMDEVKVIYSVGYPHRAGNEPSVTDGLETKAGGTFIAGKSWFTRVLGKQTGIQPFAEKQDVNAWGLDAFGIRVATISNVSQLPNSTCS